MCTSSSRGSSTLTGVDALEDCFATALAKGPRKLVLDLSGLGSIDRCGVDFFADLRQRADAVGVQLVLDSPNPAVLDTIAGVHGLRGVLDPLTPARRRAAEPSSEHAP